MSNCCMFIIHIKLNPPPFYTNSHINMLCLAPKIVIDIQGSINVIKTNQSVNHFPFKKIGYFFFFTFFIYSTLHCRVCKEEVQKGQF